MSCSEVRFICNLDRGAAYPGIRFAVKLQLKEN